VKQFFSHNQKGIGLVEVLIASAIITTGIVALIGAFTVYVSFALNNSGNVQAAYLAEEGMEVMAFMRDNGYAANIAGLSTTTTFYLTFSGGTWATTTTPVYIDNVFLRKVDLAPVYRDGNFAVVSSGGTSDANSRFVTITIDYIQGQATTTRSLSGYITNFRND
jgi:hypothetical protein